MSNRFILHRRSAPYLHFLYTVALSVGAWALARGVLILQSYFLLAPDERFPLTLDGYHEAPLYIWAYVDKGAKSLGFFTWFFLWCFTAHYLSWRVVPFVVNKFFLWWGVGLLIGGLVGYAAYTGDLEPFLNRYLPFIWKEKHTTRPGQLRETLLPPMSEDSFGVLTGIAFQVGLYANMAWFVLRWVYYRIRGEVAALGNDGEPIMAITLRGRGIREEN